MAKPNQVGGERPQGFAALSRDRRTEAATIGGRWCHMKRGREHYVAIGRKGAAAKHGHKSSNSRPR